MSALREVSNLPAKSVVDGKVKLTNRSVNTYNTHNVVPRLNKNNNNSQGVDDNIRRAYHDIHHQEKRQEQQQQSQQAPEDHNHYSQPACSSQSSQELRPLLYEPHDDDPLYCTDLVQDIMLMFFTKEKEAVRKFNEGIASYDSNTGSLHRYYASPHYLQYQPEINETMRMILVDWLIDVHIKYKLRPETMFLTVNLIDRYLSCHNTKFNSSTFVKRSKLQLVGICSLLLASKYEEIWPVEIDKCVHITANSYTREEIIEMERTMCGALCFRFTVPTSFQFATRLLNLLDGDDFLQQYSHYHSHNETEGSDDCDNMELTSQKQRLSMLNVNMMRSFNNYSNNNSSTSIKHMYNTTVNSTFTVTSINDKAEVNDSDDVMRNKKILLAEQFTLLKHVTFFFMEHALLDYKCLQFTPSQIANACVFLALVTLRLKYNIPIPSVSNINKNNKVQQSAELKRPEQEQTTSKSSSSSSSSSSITSSPQAVNSMAFHSIDSFSLAPSMTTNTNTNTNTHLPESESITPTNV